MKFGLLGLLAVGLVAGAIQDAQAASYGSIYVFGDDFSGDSISQVIDTVDRLNRSNDRGERLMRIHAVAFPVYFVMEPAKQHPNIVRFAASRDDSSGEGEVER